MDVGLAFEAALPARLGVVEESPTCNEANGLLLPACIREELLLQRAKGRAPRVIHAKAPAALCFGGLAKDIEVKRDWVHGFHNNWTVFV